MYRALLCIHEAVAVKLALQTSILRRVPTLMQRFWPLCIPFLNGGLVQSMLGDNAFVRGKQPPFTREPYKTADGGTIFLDTQDTQPLREDTPVVVVLPGNIGALL